MLIDARGAAVALSFSVSQSSITIPLAGSTLQHACGRRRPCETARWSRQMHDGGLAEQAHNPGGRSLRSIRSSAE